MQRKRETTRKEYRIKSPVNNQHYERIGRRPVADMMEQAAQITAYR
jgi:hypothetical protein